MHDTELSILAMRWIEFQRAFLRSARNRITEDLEDAADEVLHMPFDSPERAWEFVQFVMQSCEEMDVLGSLAAGPVEDLLSQHGESFIDRIESLARDNQRFRELLSGVWRNTISSDVWDRIQCLRTNDSGDKSDKGSE